MNDPAAGGRLLGLRALVACALLAVATVPVLAAQRGLIAHALEVYRHLGLTLPTLSGIAMDLGDTVWLIMTSALVIAGLGALLVLRARAAVVWGVLAAVTVALSGMLMFLGVVLPLLKVTETIGIRG